LFAEHNPFAKKPEADTARNPFARGPQKSLHKSETFFEKVDAAEKDTGPKRLSKSLVGTETSWLFLGPATKAKPKEKKPVARQTTLFGMPVVPPADKEKGKKKKATAEGDKANSAEPETQEEETQSTDVTMTDVATSQTLVEEVQVEEETQLEETGDRPEEEVRIPDEFLLLQLIEVSRRAISSGLLHPSRLP
jgi:chromosome transmission fidelity protein 4